MRKIKVGQKVVCVISGVVGNVLKFYYPTASEEQTMVKTTDGREYHAPTRTWVPYKDGMTPNIIILDEFATFEHAINMAAMSSEPAITKILNPYGEYVARFALNHGISLDEAFAHPTCKARLDLFNATGK